MEPTTQTEQAEQAEQTEEVQFTDELDIHPGMTVEVLTLDNRLTFVGKVDRFSGKAIVIRESRGGELPPVLYNKEIKLRFFLGQDSLVVHGKICGSSRTIWKLDRLESRSAKEQRAFFRQQISTSVLCKVHRCTSRGAVSKEGYFGRVMDVSAGGLMLLSTEHYAKGDRLAIIGIELTKTTAPFNFYCQVRRASPRKDGTVCYGCQFESLHPKEQDRLLQAIFAMQREEIRRQKEQGGK